MKYSQKCTHILSKGQTKLLKMGKRRVNGKKFKVGVLGIKMRFNVLPPRVILTKTQRCQVEKKKNDEHVVCDWRVCFNKHGTGNWNSLLAISTHMIVHQRAQGWWWNTYYKINISETIRMARIHYVSCAVFTMKIVFIQSTYHIVSQERERLIPCNMIHFNDIMISGVRLIIMNVFFGFACLVSAQLVSTGLGSVSASIFS